MTQDFNDRVQWRHLTDWTYSSDTNWMTSSIAVKLLDLCDIIAKINYNFSQDLFSMKRNFTLAMTSSCLTKNWWRHFVQLGRQMVDSEFNKKIWRNFYVLSNDNIVFSSMTSSNFDFILSPNRWSQFV